MKLLRFVVFSFIASFGAYGEYAIGSETRLRVPRQTEDRPELQGVPNSVTEEATVGKGQDEDGGYGQDLIECIPPSVERMIRLLREQLEELRNMTSKEITATQEKQKEESTILVQLKQQVADIQQTQAEQLAAIRQEATQVAIIQEELKHVAGNQQGRSQQVDTILQELKQEAAAIQQKQVKEVADMTEELKQSAANQLKQKQEVDTILLQLKQQVADIQLKQQGSRCNCHGQRRTGYPAPDAETLPAAPSGPYKTISFF